MSVDPRVLKTKFWQKVHCIDGDLLGGIVDVWLFLQSIAGTNIVTSVNVYAF